MYPFAIASGWRLNEAQIIIIQDIGPYALCIACHSSDILFGREERNYEDPLEHTRPYQREKSRFMHQRAQQHYGQLSPYGKDNHFGQRVDEY